MLVYPSLNPVWPVYLPDPVARHPLNDKRAAWWLTLPGWDGGPRWYDLFGRYTGTLNQMTGTGNGWRPTTRPGGWGHLTGAGASTDGSVTLMPQSAAPINFADGNSISMAIWFRTPSNATGNYPALIGCVDDVTGAGGMAIVVAPTTGGNSVYAYLSLLTGGGIGTPAGGGLGEDNLWHRALAVFDRPNLRLNFYLDGKLVNAIDTSAAASNAGMAASTALIAGGRLPTAINLNGSWDDATVWFPRALTAADAWMDFDLGRMGYPGVLNRLAPSIVAVAVPTLWLVGDSAGTFDDPATLAATLTSTEAPGATDTPPTLTGLLIVADVGAPSEAMATAGAWSIADAFPDWTELAETGTPILAIAETFAGADLPTLAMAWEWLDAFAQSDVADHYDLLTPLDESAGWDDPLGYVPTYQVSESGGADEAPTWAVWTLTASDGASLNADAATLASVLNAADRLPGDDLSGFVTPVMLVPDAGQGTEAATLTPILVCADRGTCADSATLAATLLPADSGGLAEPGITLTRVLLATEGVEGSDLPTLAASLTARDAGAASDALVSVRTGILTERGALSERLAAAALWLPTEGPTASDGTPYLAAFLPLSDSLGGLSEALLAAAGWRLAESPRAREVIISAASWAATDALGGPGEAPGLAARLVITDLDTWYEAIGDIHLMVSIREGWAPREQPALFTTYALADLGTGSDRPALAYRLDTRDGSGVADSLAVGAVLAPREAIGATDRPTLTALYDLTDAGAGRSTVLLAGGMPLAESGDPIESLGAVALLLPRETASAVDAPSLLLALGIADRATGRETLTNAATFPIGEALTPLEVYTAAFRLVVSEASIISEGIARSDAFSLAERGSWRDLASATALWGVADAGRATDRAEGAAVWRSVEGSEASEVSEVSGRLLVGERLTDYEAPSLTHAWTLVDAGAGRDASLLAYSLAWFDAGGAVEALASRGSYTAAEGIAADLAVTTAAAWVALDRGSVTDRAGAAAIVSLADSVLMADSGRLATTFRLSEAPTADAVLFATARWYASEGLGAVETPSTVPTLPATRQDTHLHSRIVPAAGTPAAPRARVTPVAPTARITPAPGTPDPGRSTVQ